MEFKKCNGCGRNVSVEHVRCPYCGHSFKKGGGLGALAGGLVVLGIAAFVGFRMYKPAAASRDAGVTGAQDGAVGGQTDDAAKQAAEAKDRAAEVASIEADAAAERKAEAARVKEAKAEEAKLKADEAAAKAAAAKSAAEEKLWRETRYKELLEVYRKKFKDLTGREVILGMSTGTKMKGTLKAVRPDAVVLTIAKGEVEIPKKDLTKGTCTMCYKEEYAQRYAKIQLGKEAKERVKPDEEPETQVAGE